jgi:hypothetical protein
MAHVQHTPIDLPHGLTHHHRHTQDSHTQRRRSDALQDHFGSGSELLWCTATEVPSLEAPPLLLV